MARARPPSSYTSRVVADPSARSIAAVLFRFSGRALVCISPLIAVALTVLRRPQRDEFYTQGPGSDRRDGELFARIVLRLAAQDWLLLVYLTTLLAEVWVGNGPRRQLALAWVAMDLVLFAGVVWMVRGGVLENRFSAALVYRFGVLAALLGSFLELQWILPAASGPSVDAHLYALDVRLFGTEPALAWDRFVRPSTTEWFAFFYYGYFILVAVHVLPALFFGRAEKFLVPFGFGFLWLYCVGHVVYTLVPAYGPHAYLKFTHSLEGRLWWPLVQRTVASVDGSARTDVFPSLHTAGPAYLALFSFTQRARLPFRISWMPLVFVATQIIIATMFLRWHYLVDVCAGLLLAGSGLVVGRLALAWDTLRASAGGPPVWPPYTSAWYRPEAR